MDSYIKGPEWASGCPLCRWGIVSRPVVKVMTMAIVEAVLNQYGLVQYCGCQAGTMRRQYARRVWRKLEKGEEYLSPDLAQLILDKAKERVMNAGI